ncbi:MAG: SGNH/GDSL hydrolase family protein [Deltaproteobacteria bacterium]|nr:SGNH/GDSL hydrolase family protein [Deltaproteobacteria bacterium]MBI3296474.1 SGNH/GDSL hydrolase family protein [Deltaproteobacteria bacterium]
MHKLRLTVLVGLSVSSLIGIELFLQIAFFLKRGEPLFRRPLLSVFSIREYTEWVPDERVVTLKKDYGATLGGVGRRWHFSSDSDRFRRIPGAAKNEKGAAIVFLGDSVPFGYGLDDGESVPAQFWSLIKSRGDSRKVINAAIPSYSLLQAVTRLAVEIIPRVAIDTVILQVYDPASQFAALGKAWRPQANWATNSQSWASPWALLAFDFGLKYSALYQAGLRASFKISQMGTHSPRIDPDAVQYFRDVNVGTLRKLHDLIQQKQGHLLLVSTNPPALLMNSDVVRQSELMAAIRSLNNTLKEFAEEHNGVRFVDMSAHFEQLPDPLGLFIDECCHLSPRGSLAQAEFLFESMW